MDIDQIKNYPDDKVVLITTGSQGESMAALSRMAANIHKKVTIKPNDTIIFSSNPIPGNEKAVSKVINELSRKGADVIFQDAHTLVGVLGIDSLLFAQGFRAYETVFSLITQVVGRSGRAKDPGFAIIQTTDPDNPVLNLAAAQDYDAFFEQEIAYRKLGLYPPFCGLCVVGFSGPKEVEVARAAARFSALLGRQAAQQPDLPLRVLGPTPGNIEKINENYRYKLTIKCRADKRFRDLVRQTLGLYEQEKLPSKATVVVDMHSDGDI